MRHTKTEFTCDAFECHAREVRTGSTLKPVMTGPPMGWHEGKRGELLCPKHYRAQEERRMMQFTQTQQAMREHREFEAANDHVYPPSRPYRPYYVGEVLDGKLITRVDGAMGGVWVSRTPEEQIP